MAANISQESPQSQADYHPLPKSQTLAVSFPHPEAPSFSLVVDVYERAQPDTTTGRQKLTTCLKRSDFELPRKSEKAPSIVDGSLVLNERSGEMERCEKLDGWERSCRSERNRKNDTTGFAGQEDGSGRKGFHETCNRTHPDIERRVQVGDEEAVSLEQATPQNDHVVSERLPERNAADKEGCGSTQLYRVPQGTCADSGDETPDVRSIKIIGSQEWIGIDRQICARTGYSGETPAFDHDTVKDGVEEAVGQGKEAKKKEEIAQLEASPGLEGKHRSMQMMRSELLPKPPPMALPLNPYLDPGLLENNLLTDTPAGYMRIHSSLISSSPRVFMKLNDKATQEGVLPSLNPPVTETVIWENIRPFIPVDRWSVVQKILDPAMFKEEVLLETGQDEIDCKLPSFPRSVQKELLRLGYVRRSPTTPKCLCRLFCVPRPDKKLRLIWDGRALNKMCFPPPKFHLRNTLDHVKDLFASSVHAYYILDMKTWFCQLKPHPKVARYFGTRLHDGFFILVGLPMGWAWAPVIAQFVAEGVAACILRSLPELKQGGVIIVYIDNIILGLPQALVQSAELVADKVKRACDSVGAIIKEGSQKFGTRVEWLGVEIDCVLRKLRLKKTFVQKLFEATKDIMKAVTELSKSIRQWYAVLSCVIYAIWNLEGSLWRLPKQVEWMSSLSKLLLLRSENWESPTSIPRDTLKDMKGLLKQILKNKWSDLPLDLAHTQPRAVGYSDASNTSMAWSFHSTKEMRLCVEVAPAKNDAIFERELMAMINGQSALIKALPPFSSYYWKTDNMGALFVSRRELSCVWRMNEALGRLHTTKREKMVVADLAYVPSKENPADEPSRMNVPLQIVSPACGSHPGRDCGCYRTWMRKQCEWMKMWNRKKRKKGDVNG